MRSDLVRRAVVDARLDVLLIAHIPVSGRHHVKASVLSGLDERAVPQHLPSLVGVGVKILVLALRRGNVSATSDELKGFADLMSGLGRQLTFNIFMT
ncbi:MAG: hypothetical protein GIX03_11850 [Candidatus Eremiobacteraeota bacterium]|nr:hypothetical protein [Candidatus Eremiobacteraeota bacterium]MBC5803660.1 hypothetical protein [Candidatus Eremiobacteraeota bacterium]MBC5822330.1 hypothetical protein [Candidatus Eremiobacteraeota bacterium]